MKILDNIKRVSLQFSKKHYRIKFGIALTILLLTVAAVVFIIYKNSLATADITQPKETNYLPTVDYDKGDFFLNIDKISVNAPVIPDVDGANKEVYFSSLQKGVAHMSGTAKPGEKGNVVLFGHSNYYENDPGLYKQIFKNLDDMESGDNINIRYLGQDYNYTVIKQQIVKPEDTWVISAPYDLTLITCWPPGTIEKRLIIFANLQK